MDKRLPRIPKLPIRTMKTPSIQKVQVSTSAKSLERMEQHWELVRGGSTTAETMEAVAAEAAAEKLVVVPSVVIFKKLEYQM